MMMSASLPLTFLGAAGAALSPFTAPAPGQPGVWAVHEEHVLGAPANFIVTALEEADVAAAVSAARAEIERLNGIFNTRRVTSEISQLNNARSMRVSQELFDVLSLAERLREASSGAYNGRLGMVLGLWRSAEAAAPDADVVLNAAAAAQGEVRLERATRTVIRPEGAAFDVDSLAKGYIVDAALKAGMAAAPVRGMAVDIGGDMACAGCAPNGLFWEVGVPEPSSPLALARDVAQANLMNQAIATSGMGPRDFFLGGERYSATLSPFTGQPVTANTAATVIAPTTAEADGLATALLTMDAEEGLELAESWPGAEARIAAADGRVMRTGGWAEMASEPAPALDAMACQSPSGRWMADWAVQIVYEAPDRAVSRREADFRTPYMAMWITDKNNNPIRTLVLVGTRPEWHEDNYIWYNMYRDKAENLIRLRSSATQLSGAYPTYWPGYNDDWQFVGQGEYVLHIETSRERGRHTYRTMPLSLGPDRFSTSMPKTEEGGGFRLTYGKRE